MGQEPLDSDVTGEDLIEERRAPVPSERTSQIIARARLIATRSHREVVELLREAEAAGMDNRVAYVAKHLGLSGQRAYEAIRAAFKAGHLGESTEDTWEFLWESIRYDSEHQDLTDDHEAIPAVDVAAWIALFGGPPPEEDVDETLPIDPAEWLASLEKPIGNDT